MNKFKLGIVGYPLSHTVSPLLHSVFFEITGTQGRFEKFEIPPEQFFEWIDSVKTSFLNGFNVTIPYKIKIMPYLNSISKEAEMIGSINTVICKEEGLVGENTDQFGFTASLDYEIREQLSKSHLLILGTGGSSRAVVYALLQKGVKKITFLARNMERAKETLEKTEMMNQYPRHGEVIIQCVTAISPAEMMIFDGVVNTTPVGMYKQIEETPLHRSYLEKLPPGAFVYDLIYNPTETRLLKDAKSLGLRTFNGLDMLIYQGLGSFELWTGLVIPRQSLEMAWKDIVRLLNASLTK